MHYSMKDGCFVEERGWDRGGSESLLSGPKLWVSVHAAIIFRGNHGRVKVFDPCVNNPCLLSGKGPQAAGHWQVGGKTWAPAGLIGRRGIEPDFKAVP